MDRRRFLGGSLAAAGGIALGGSGLRNLGPTRSTPMRPSPERLLDLPAREAPIDTVVVVMLENRSFDHLLGWLARDQAYLERGRKRHGADFRVIGSNHERYRAPDGKVHTTRNTLALDTADPLRGCGYRVPGHSWGNGRVQRDDPRKLALQALELGRLQDPDLREHRGMGHARRAVRVHEPRI
ncbi:MAG: hypothetical protein MUP67_01065, partial [Acidimicrobiia bacterium]|nr:hypothetical protein [Acidimicrobiia bacterium]